MHTSYCLQQAVRAKQKTSGVCAIITNTGFCVGAMLGQRRRRWANIEPTHGHVFSGNGCNTGVGGGLQCEIIHHHSLTFIHGRNGLRRIDTCDGHSKYHKQHRFLTAIVSVVQNQTTVTDYLNKQLLLCVIVRSTARIHADMKQQCINGFLKSLELKNALIYKKKCFKKWLILGITIIMIMQS